MKRSLALEYMRIAGYEGDKAAWTRLLVENRVSYKAAQEAFNQGRMAAERKASR